MSTLRVNNMTNAGGTGPTYASGHVIQVQTFTTTTDTEATSTSFQNTPITGTITPKSANSKIVVTVSMMALRHTNSLGGSIFTVFRGDNTGVNIGSGSNGLGYRWQNQSVMSDGNVCVTVTDTPNSTSPVTYTVGLRSENASNIARTVGLKVITLMEVAA